MASVHIPTPNDLDDVPELAVLAVLEAALLAAEHGLTAAEPRLRELPCGPAPPHTDHVYWAAYDITVVAETMQNAIDRYRSAVHIRLPQRSRLR